jgi:GNAT superfamily N-acetyltransferase
LTSCCGRLDPMRWTLSPSLRSKGHWGYDQPLLTACRPDLTVTPESCHGVHIVLADNGVVLGYYQLAGVPPRGELTDLFVDPSAIGRGLGRRLLEHALVARLRGARHRLPSARGELLPEGQRGSDRNCGQRLDPRSPAASPRTARPPSRGAATDVSNHSLRAERHAPDRSRAARPPRRCWSTPFSASDSTRPTKSLRSTRCLHAKTRPASRLSYSTADSGRPARILHTLSAGVG